MEKRFIVIILALMVVLAVVGFLFSKVALAPAVGLEECKTLKYNGESAQNIVFFADKEIAQKYYDDFSKMSPFDKYMDRFNFYYINSYQPKCEIYKEIAILCYSPELIKKAASCPNDFIVVVDSANPTMRSSNYMNVMSLNAYSSISVFQHEFGHSFGALSDEYVPAVLPKKAKNCVSDCDSFNGKNDGCFEGCSLNEKYRSIDRGIMKTLSADSYGSYDEILLLEKLGVSDTITGFAVSENRDCSKERYNLVKGNYVDGKIEILDNSIEQGCLGENGAGDFSYNLELQNGNVLGTRDFNPELIFTDSQSEGESELSGGSEEKSGEFYLKIPIIENSKSLRIADADGNILTELNLIDSGGRPCKA